MSFVDDCPRKMAFPIAIFDDLRVVNLQKMGGKLSLKWLDTIAELSRIIPVHGDLDLHGVHWRNPNHL